MRWTGWALGVGAAIGTFFLGRQVLAAISQMRSTPARALSMTEAIEQMRAYARQGLVQILSEGSGPSPRWTVSGKIAGIQHIYLDKSGEQIRSQIDNLDPRFGVFLVRLDILLKKLGVTKLIDLGITHGSDNEQDVHNQGRALDVAGLKGPGIDLNVYRDWGKKPEKPGFYRLSSRDSGYKIFQAIYNFGTLEGADRSCDQTPRPEGPPTKIGQASCLITPDHPSPKLRKDHQNHMHIQVGKTFGVLT